MATFVALRDPVTPYVTNFTSPNNLTNVSPILKLYEDVKVDCDPLLLH